MIGITYSRVEESVHVNGLSFANFVNSDIDNEIVLLEKANERLEKEIDVAQKHVDGIRKRNSDVTEYRDHVVTDLTVKIDEFTELKKLNLALIESIQKTIGSTKNLKLSERERVVVIGYLKRYLAQIKERKIDLVGNIETCKKDKSCYVAYPDKTLEKFVSDIVKWHESDIEYKRGAIERNEQEIVGLRNVQKTLLTIKEFSTKTKRKKPKNAKLK